MKVSNIKIEEIKHNLKDKGIAENISYIKLLKEETSIDIPNISDLLPSIPYHKVTFELSNTNVDFANAIRRVIVSEVNIDALTFDSTDFSSDDIYLLYDNIQLRMNAIPFKQNISKEILKNWSISLNVHNKINKPIKIYSKDIEIIDKKTNKKINTKSLFPQNIILFGDSCLILSPETRNCIGQYYDFVTYSIKGYLYKHNKGKNIDYDKLTIVNRGSLPIGKILDNIKILNIADRMHLFTVEEYGYGLHSGKSLNIKNIKIISGNGLQNANSFILAPTVLYKILDVKPLLTTKYKTTGKSCLVSNPTKFRLGYITYGNIEPKMVIKKTCKELKDRLNNILLELNSITKDKLPYFSNTIQIKITKDLYQFHLVNEYWTIGNIISRYVYIEDSNITFCAPSLIHPNINTIIIKLKHINALEIIKKAIKKIFIDLEILNKSFS